MQNNTMTNLPQGWEVKKLGDIAEISSGGTPSRNKKEYWENGIIPWVKIKDIKKNFISTTEEFITKDSLKNSSAKLFKKGTLLYSVFATLGKVAILDIDATTNQAIAGISIKENNINSLYLMYFLKSIKDEICSKGRGVAQNNLNLSILKQIQIPLPPLKEQERIVGVLDESFANIDESIKILEQDLLNLDELMQSALQKAFNPLKDDAKGNYQLPQGWEWKSLGDISNYGKTSQVKPSQLKGNDWILELEDIEKESGVLLQKVLFQDRQSKSNKIKFNKGDILFGTLRPYLKKVIIADDNGACSSEIMPFSTGNSITNHFIYYYLFANFLHDRISSLTYGARMPRLGTKDGKSLQIPLPPLQEQEQIAKHLDFVFEKAKALKELYTKELQDYEELKQSLLDKAFKGEL
ncbi:restriction endonuclease subunit S [Campylobacter jejuni]|uniref:restriction endonuclease subunit S n=1 Tax=Campylobacter jejuni TaxID=197 RepID=UPI003B9C5AD6